VKSLLKAQGHGTSGMKIPNQHSCSPILDSDTHVLILLVVGRLLLLDEALDPVIAFIVRCTVPSILLVTFLHSETVFLLTMGQLVQCPGHLTSILLELL
jgi:hypothetical protein